MKTRGLERGFTLVEVMIALAIVALTVVFLLGKRVDVVREAARSRDVRTVWLLASQKIAELELDPTVWQGPGTQSNGDFGEMDPSYAAYAWDYTVSREIVPTNDPAKLDEKPSEIFRLAFQVNGPEFADPLKFELLQPAPEFK